MSEQPEALHPCATDSELRAELRRLRAANGALLAALKALYVAAPTTTNCHDFHHSADERHAFGAECKPVADYLAALAGARCAIAECAR